MSTLSSPCQVQSWHTGDAQEMSVEEGGEGRREIRREGRNMLTHGRSERSLGSVRAKRESGWPGAWWVHPSLSEAHRPVITCSTSVFTKGTCRAGQCQWVNASHSSYHRFLSKSKEINLELPAGFKDPLSNTDLYARDLSLSICLLGILVEQMSRKRSSKSGFLGSCE